MTHPRLPSEEKFASAPGCVVAGSAASPGWPPDSLPEVVRRGVLAARSLARAARALLQPRLLRQGLDAIARGNLEAAFWLLREDAERRSDDPRSVLAFFDVARACGRAEQASGPLAGMIHRQAASGEKSLAADCWVTLIAEVPDAVVDAPTLARLVPELESRLQRAQDRQTRREARAHLVQALRRCVEPSAPGLTPGLALHVFELARSRDAESARRAAQVALGSPEMHEAKRERIEILLDELEREPSGAEATSEEKPEACSVRLAVTEAVPVELTEQGLLIEETESRRRAQLDYRAVEAIAVGQVHGLAPLPLLIVDLVLRFSPRRPELRPVVRMRGDTFDPTALVPDCGDATDAQRVFLAELLERTHAVPLPDPDSALGLQPCSFDSLDDHEREILERLA
jgi:hypothetical protein